MTARFILTSTTTHNQDGLSWLLLASTYIYIYIYIYTTVSGILGLRGNVHFNPTTECSARETRGKEQGLG